MSNSGRKTIMLKNVVQKLNDSLRLGFNVSEACEYAGISRSTFYLHLQENREFSDKIAVSRLYIKHKAKALILNAIESGDLKTAKWYLEKYDVEKTSLFPVVPLQYQPLEISEEERQERLAEVARAYNKEGEFATTELDPEARIL